MSTTPTEFRKFADALVQTAPSDYQPHLIPLMANGKEPDGLFITKRAPPKSPCHNQYWTLIGKSLKCPECETPKSSWKAPYAKLTIAQAEERLRKGENVGLGAMEKDPLVIIDVDEVQAVPFNTIKPTLSVRTSRRQGFHFFFMGGDKADNLNCALGEVRSKDEYVVCAGSFVTPIAEKLARIPKEERENAGRYTVEIKRDPAVFNNRDIPRAFFENQAHLQYVQDTNKSKASPELEAVKARVSITDVLSKYGHDTQRSPTQCPICKCQCECFSYLFAQDKIFFCWNSERKHRISGDIFHLVALLEGLTCENDFPEVLRRFSDKFNVTIGTQARDEVEPENTEEQKENIELTHRTDHLPNFQLINDLIGLYGKEYTTLKKIVWYSTIGTLYRKDTYAHTPDLIVDGRVHLLAVFPSGKGKSNVKAFRKGLAIALGLRYANPTVLHPEQAVGKMLTKITGKGTKAEQTIYEPNPGFLSYDLIDLDEIRELLTSKDLKVSETRGHIRIALDPYGKNTVEKKLVDHKPEQTLSYVPPVILDEFTQKEFIYPQELIFSGDLRRVRIAYLSTSTPRREIYESRLSSRQGSREEKYANLVLFLRKLEPFSLPVESDVNEALMVYSEVLINLGASVGRKASQLANTLEQSVLGDLLQFALLLALARGASALKKIHVQMAFTDLFEIFHSGYSFAQDCLDGVFISQGLKPEHTRLLVWLEEQDATSLEKSKVSIAEFDARIMSCLKVESRQANACRTRLKSQGWLDYKQVGQHGSRVWLAKDLPGKVQGCEGSSPYNTFKLINYIIDTYLVGETPQPLQPSNVFLPGQQQLPVLPPNSLKQNNERESVAEVVRRLDTGDGAYVPDVLRALGEGAEARLAHSDKVGDTFEVAGHRDRRKVLE